jgi:tRNA G18 (ribose-2'-O)-methylase SpoU
MPILIEHPDDPRIEGYRQVRERDLVGREGGFVIEGEVVLRTAVRAGRHDVASVLIDAKRLGALADVLAALPPEVPVYAASQAVLDRIVGFHIHRGVLALGRRGAEAAAPDLLEALPARALVAALFGIGNHDNMGGIFRNCAAFGVDAVLLGADCCDPLYRKAIRVSVGASLMIPTARLRAGEDPLQALEQAGFEVVALSPAGAVPLNELRRGARVAALFGSEGPGLPAEILARARTAAIPMAPGFDSLNVAVASGVVLHHLAFG